MCNQHREPERNRGAIRESCPSPSNPTLPGLRRQFRLPPRDPHGTVWSSCRSSHASPRPGWPRSRTPAASFRRPGRTASRPRSQKRMFRRSPSNESHAGNAAETWPPKSSSRPRRRGCKPKSGHGPTDSASRRRRMRPADTAPSDESTNRRLDPCRPPAAYRRNRLHASRCRLQMQRTAQAPALRYRLPLPHP